MNPLELYEAPMGIINWYYYLSWQKNTKAAEEAEKERKKREAEQKNVKNVNTRVHPYQNKRLATSPQMPMLPSQAIEDLVDEFE